jgi:hypothetical protein
MSQSENKKDVLIQQVIEQERGAPLSTRRGVELCDQAGIWPQDEIDTYVYRYKASHFRRVAQKEWEDEQGHLWEMVNVVVAGEGPDAKPERVYLPLEKTTEAQSAQVILYHIKEHHRERDKVDYLFDDHERRFGRKKARQLRIKYNWPEPEPATP